jgi:Mycothiol maleylpyruvate isomerase N-terminal domain
MTGRREIDAFVEALDGVPPNTVTACAGWTAHELVAHLTSGVEAIASTAQDLGPRARQICPHRGPRIDAVGQAGPGQ